MARRPSRLPPAANVAEEKVDGKEESPDDDDVSSGESVVEEVLQQPVFNLNAVKEPARGGDGFTRREGLQF